MKTSHSRLRLTLVFLIADISGQMTYAEPGVMLTREYVGQTQDLWKPIVFTEFEESFASVKIVLPNAKAIIHPKANIGRIIVVPDLKTLQLIRDSDLKLIEKQTQELSQAIKQFSQLEDLLGPLVNRLNVAITDYNNGYSYLSGQKIFKTETTPTVKPTDGLNLDIAGTRYNQVQVTNVTPDAISFMHANGVTTMPRSTLKDETLKSLEQKWPKPFAQMAERERRDAEMASVREKNAHESDLKMESSIAQSRALKQRLLSRLAGIYGSQDEDALLNQARKIALLPTDQPTMLSDISMLAKSVNRALDAAESQSKISGDSVKDIVDAIIELGRGLAKDFSRGRTNVLSNQRPKITDEEKAKINTTRVAVAIRVQQAIRGAALCWGSRIDQVPQGGAWNGLQRAPGIRISEEHSEPIYVIGLPTSTVDGDTFAGWLYPCGTHEYTTILGAAKTVRKYATTLEGAIRDLE